MPPNSKNTMQVLGDSSRSTKIFKFIKFDEH